jgi:chromate transporter
MTWPEQQPIGRRPSIAQLFLAFLRLGATAFGGPAMLAYIRKLAVEQQWLDEAATRDGIAVCQMLPGATAMQMAAYVGLRTRGVIGAAASFIGFGLPAFLLMVLLSAFYIQAHTLPAVVAAFNGLQAIVVAIVANATLAFGKATLTQWRHAGIAAFAAILFGLAVNPILVILGAAGLGLAFATPPPPPSQAIPASRSSSPRTLLMLVTVALMGFVALFLAQRPLFDLAILMARIDLFAFGGGYASVPLMFHEVVDVRSWMDGPTFLSGILLGQVTPGPIVITATFIGYWLYGPLGALIATINVFLPSFLMVVGVVPYFDKLRASPAFNRAIGGVLCSFVGLLLTVTVRFAGNISWDVPHVLLAGAALIALLMKVDLLWVVVVGAVLSVVVL